MKKNLLAASGLLICGVMLFHSCQKENPVTPGNTSYGNSSLRSGAPDPWTFGDIHNNTMNYVLGQVDGVPFATHEDANNAAYLHLSTYFSANHPEFDLATIDIHGGLAYKDEHINSVTFPTVNFVTLAQQQINNLQSEGLIAPSESQIIMNLFTSIEASRVNGSGASGVELALQAARQQWDAQHYNSDEQEGFLSAAVIAVGTGSVAYWQTQTQIRDTPDGPGPALAIPFWVGCDVVGALAGGGSSMYSQRNNASYDWGEIGGQALIWGASSSLLGSSRFRAFFN